MTHTQRVLITGASSGIGRGMARRFLQEGAKLILNGRDADKLEAVRRELDGGDRVVTVPGSIADPATARALAQAARERFGGLDVLINNAGIFGIRPFLETPIDELDGYFQTNVRGTFLVTQALVPLLIEAGGGAIINTGTVLVTQGQRDLPVAAAMASKGGVHALTVSLAAELGRYGIRVHTLAPGIIQTPLVGDADPFADHRPIARTGHVDDTADAALFLARAPYVTGGTLDVDGGYAHAR